MITNFSDESKDLISKARKKGIGQTDPVVKEELFFRFGVLLASFMDHIEKQVRFE